MPGEKMRSEDEIVNLVPEPKPKLDIRDDRTKLRDWGVPKKPTKEQIKYVEEHDKNWLGGRGDSSSREK